MNTNTLMATALIGAAALTAQPAALAAETSLAMEQMAQIVLNLEQKPDADAQHTLEVIAEDSASTYNERVLASSIKNLDKKIRPDDKPTVLKVWTNPAASESERELARILLRFNEQPTEDAKATLNQWVEP